MPTFTTMKAILLVFAGGGLGSVFRYAFGQWLPPSSGNFPWATFWVNLIGSLFIGCFLGWSLTREGGWRLLLISGFCGGFTTFSAFSAECLHLIRQQQLGSALGYVLASLLLGICATAFGLFLTKNVSPL